MPPTAKDFPTAPASRDNNPANAPGKACDYRLNAATPTALVIDDNEIYRDLVREMLEELGWTVETAPNGQDGGQIAQRREFDLVVCDIIMPHHDGYETIHRIRDYQPAVHIIAISSGAILHSDLYLRMAHWFGADAVLPKPFGIYDLCAAMRGMFRARQAGASSSLPAFDRHIFSRLAETVTPASLRKLARTFEDEVDRRLAAMRAAAARHDHERVREQAHTLRSSAALFGLSRLSGVSASLEELAAVHDDLYQPAAIETAATAADEGRRELQAALG
jgi:CheY-like chemotaxis protein